PRATQREVDHYSIAITPTHVARDDLCDRPRITSVRVEPDGRTLRRRARYAEHNRGDAAYEFRANDPTATCEASSVVTRSMTDSQSSARVCLNRRMVGYQGVSSRPSIQRQSACAGNRVHVRTPSAPARWAESVSTQINKSSERSVAASSRILAIGGTSAPLPLQLASAGPRCRIWKRISSSCVSSCISCTGMERRESQLPDCQTSPTCGCVRYTGPHVLSLTWI